MKITPRNWREFQHYKDRNPPWIRLHKGLLDNFDFQRLPVASRALAPMLWLIASDATDGVIDADPEKLAFRLRMSVDEVSDALKPLISKGFFDVQQGASSPLAEREQVAVPETEALQRQRQRTETEAETRAPKRASPPPVSRPEDVDEQTWGDWLALRKGKKAAVSVTVLTEARREAGKAGITLQRFFEVWCARGSQGLQAEWLKPDERSGKSFRERDAEIAAARVHEMTGGLVSAKPIRRDALQEVFDAIPSIQRIG